MKRTPVAAISIVAVLLAVLVGVLGSIALAAQDRFTLKVPNGLAFAEFKGYETWQNVAVSQTASEQVSPNRRTCRSAEQRFVIDPIRGSAR